MSDDGRQQLKNLLRKASPIARFDPGEHTVVEVEQYLVDHPDQADAVLTAEAAGKDRATLRRLADEDDG